MRVRPEPENLGGGLWSVPVPIPGNPLGYTLVYALESERGPVLVDAGWNHPDAWEALSGGLGAVGLDVTDVYGVVVTHFHPDHAGLAGQVREASGAWVAMHHEDAALIRRIRTEGSKVDEAWMMAEMRRAGAGPAELAERFEHGRMPPPADPDRELSDGELVDLPGRKLRTVWTPGHTPGHICLHLEDGDRIFTGDHVLPRITPHIALYPYDAPADVDPLGDFLASLERVAEVPAGEVLPAHQYRFAGLGDRVQEIIDHHEERLTSLMEMLAAGPATLWQLAAGMPWRDPWDQMPLGSRRMATAEAAAHLRTLERRGLVHRQGSDDVIGFARG
ncbi:MBL fold metallo-hydrolase [Actinomadura craniellae]|uniref:MBL fold metallo-hydrolase n=1 Tax=Actinomadura craniellae TaxID=2231787 RepID=UPI001F373040|nr:MBL fold metallo-hydrolase [Actinomadura craniellae]